MYIREEKKDKENITRGKQQIMTDTLIKKKVQKENEMGNEHGKGVCVCEKKSEKNRKTDKWKETNQSKKKNDKKNKEKMGQKLYMGCV